MRRRCIPGRAGVARFAASAHRHEGSRDDENEVAAPVGDRELNICLVSVPARIAPLRAWAEERFQIPSNHSWRTITPLTRAPIVAGQENLFFIGDAARVVEPFTGEGIYYALRSGELAAAAITKVIRGENRPLAAPF